VDRLNVLFLLDVSDSVSLAARENAFRFAAQAAQSLQPGDQAGLIVFGEEAVVDQTLKPSAKLDRPQVQVGGRGTNLAQALQLALATAPPGHANRFVLLTDGRQNAGNALAVAQAAKDAGADVFYVPAPLTFKQEVVVESMVLPVEVKFGEPFQAKVVAWSQADTQGRLSLYRNGEFLGSQVVRMAAGKNVYTYRQALEQSGIHVYQAAIEVEGDTIEENNRAVGHGGGARPAPGAAGREGQGPGPDAGRRPARPARGRGGGGAGPHPQGHGGAAEVRRDHPLQCLVAQDDQEADGEHPGLRPRPGGRAHHAGRRGELRTGRLLPHAHRGSPAGDHGGEAEARDPEPRGGAVHRPLGLHGHDHRQQGHQARHRQGSLAPRGGSARRAERGGA
jgi:hypothetical protein